MPPLIPIQLLIPPGVVATESMRACEGRYVPPWFWYRFRLGKPQKMGGWVQAASAATSGQPRSSLAWSDFALNRYIAVGTYRKLYVYDTILAQNDITPFRLTSSGIGGGSNLTNPFTTTAGSSLVQVTQTANGVSPGDTVIFTAVGSAVGGITAGQLTGTFVCSSVVNINNYLFDCGVVASSSAGPGGGTVSYEYEITVGSELGSGGYGWGVGPYGQDFWGTPRAQTTILFEARVWSLDNFGKILLAAPAPNASLYSFDPTQNQPWPRALVVSAAPTNIRAIVVTPEQFVLALCEGMVVNGSTQGDFTIWTPATNNTAFSRTMTVGSRLIGGKVLGPFVTLVWTDSALYKFQYTGSQFVYESQLVGRDCGLVGPNAAVTVSGIAYWIGPDNFWMFDGSQVVPMPNVEDIRKFVFDQANLGNAFQFMAGYNSPNDEIWFEITVVGQTFPTLLVIYHRVDQRWTLHPGMTRASMIHFNSGDTRPYLWDAPTGFLYQHENTMDGNGSPINAVMNIAPYPLGGGQQGAPNFMGIEGMRCDTFQQVGNAVWTLNCYDTLADTLANSTIIDTLSQTVPAPGGTLQDFRIAGRYVGLQIAMSGLGSYMRLGAPTAMARVKGRRRG